MMIDFKFDALSIQVSLHGEPPEVWLVEKLSGSLYWWVELLCQPYIESATTLSDKRKKIREKGKKTGKEKAGKKKKGEKRQGKREKSRENGKKRGKRKKERRKRERRKKKEQVIKRRSKKKEEKILYTMALLYKQGFRSAQVLQQ